MKTLGSKMRNVVSSIGNKIVESSRKGDASKSMSRTVRSPFKKLARKITRG